jgi:hypothetical protein
VAGASDDPGHQTPAVWPTAQIHFRYTCVISAEPDMRDERTEEMTAAIGRLLRGG